MAKVGVVFGGRSVEHRVSVTSARTVAKGLAEAGHEVVGLGIAPDGGWVPLDTAARALAGEVDAFEPVGRSIGETLPVLLEAAVDCAFPIVHGTFGEDGTLQGLFEMLGLPYVGPGVTASAVAMDKLVAKSVLAAAGIPVVEYRGFRRERFEAEPAACLAETEALPLPLFVKPSVGGSSVGVVKVEERGALAEAIRFALRFDDAVLVEKGVAGRELEVAVLGGRPLAASVVGEIVPGREFYDYSDKYLTDGAQLLAPADLPEAASSRIRSTATAAFAALGGWGLARVDFFLAEDGALFVNELNTLPGFTAISMYPRLWGLTGLPLPQLVDRLVALAFERQAERERLDAGIKGWLAELAVRG
ncbi:MAG TPA: D-alanine--D-alanine ligase family protein [Thermoanaerobaculia bacterium]|nr:D-alanine--D-alanine ligase family protein [Thermoanaerobaculia bacterium]